MACALGITRTRFFLRKILLCEQTVIKIRKCAMSQEKRQYRQYVELSKILQTMAPFLDANHVTLDLCLSVRNDMINKHVISEDAVDTKILDICLKQKKVQTAKEYINCLQSNGYFISLYTLAKYLEFYRIESPTSMFERNQIINICTKIKKEWNYVPISIKKNCVIALCQTHKWKMALDFIKDSTKHLEDFSTLLMSYVIPAAFRNRDAKLGLELLEQVKNFHIDGHKTSSIYQEYLNYFLRNEQSNLNVAIVKIFSLWRKYNVVPIKYIVDLFVNAYYTTGWNTAYVTINRNGYCCSCGNYLLSMTVSGKDFQELADYVLNKTLVGDDVFQSTTPQELNEFKRFLHLTRPYDIVIDGLNMFHVSNLQQIIASFSIDKKILIIARRHLRKFLVNIMRMDNVHIYYLENTTQDDPFILYATLMSGSNAKFVSLDLLREHYHKFDDDKIRRLFKRWQYTHQYISDFDEQTGKVTVTPPWLYEPFAQYSNKHWHIPYRMDNVKLKLLYQPVDTWVCFRSPPKLLLH